jgi:uncharacterized protein YjbJ (UPF0337 family)
MLGHDVRTEWALLKRHDLPKGARRMSNHKGEETTGRVKEAIGDLTGDESLKREGQVDQASAKTKKTVDDVADKIKEVVHPK